MTTFTKEQLISHARESVSYLENLKGRVSKEGADCKVVIEMVARDLKLARIALASLEADPVKRVNSDQMRRVCLEANRHLDKYDAMAKEVNKLLGRIAPPAPVLPHEWRLSNAQAFIERYSPPSVEEAALFAWNSCRAAMLHGAEPVSQTYKLNELAGNYPVTPDGWVMVPKELTPEMMRAVQIRSELGGYATSNLSGAYNMFSEFWNVAVSAAPKVDDL